MELLNIPCTYIFISNLDLSGDKQLNESIQFLQRRFSTSTRFSSASQNLEHAELCKFVFTILFFKIVCVIYFLLTSRLYFNISAFTSLQSFRPIPLQKNCLNMDETHLQQNESIDLEHNADVLKIDESLNTQYQHTRNNNPSLSYHFNK